MTNDKRLTEDEFLKREARLAQEALQRLRGETMDSLRRSMDVNAWTEDYPLPVIGTAAVTGLAAGWTLGRGFRSDAERDGETKTESEKPDVEKSTTKESDSHPASRMMSGLGTLAGALASAVVAAASEAMIVAVKDTVRDTLHPQATATPSTNGHAQE